MQRRFDGGPGKCEAHEMNEKPVKLPMEFGEALARLARVPKAAVKNGHPLEVSVEKPHNQPSAPKTRRAASKRNVAR